MLLHASNLKGVNRCTTRRERDLHLETRKNEVFDRVVLQKRAIKNWFYSKALRRDDAKILKAIALIKSSVERDDVDPDDLYAFDGVRSILRMAQVDLDTDFDERKAMFFVKIASQPIFVERVFLSEFMTMDFETVDTLDAQMEMTTRIVLRYLQSEERIPMIPEEKQMNLFGIDTIVKPDLIFFDEKTGDIEAVKICCRKPDITKGSKKMDKGVKTSLELYALWRYARDLIDDKKVHTISASYYFLRRSDDRKDDMKKDFWSSTNVVSLSEPVKSTGISKTDELFEPQFLEFIVGSECSGDTCQECEFNMLCNYNAAPLKSTVPKKRKSIHDIELTKDQEDAVFFRKGIARVNAGAGAGKTLVVALRTAYMLDEGIAPEEILLVTFTDAGAKEMLERIEMYDEDLGTETDMSKLACKTFNAFGNDIIKKEYARLGYAAEPRLIDDIERKKVITDLLAKTTVPGLDYRNFMLDTPFAKGALAVCEEAFRCIKKDRLSSYSVTELEQAMLPMSASISDPGAYQALLDLYLEYEEELRDRCLIEFQDQEKLLFDLIDIDPYYLDSLGYRHIVVDEFQDSSDNQIVLIKKLIECSDFESLMIVGDDSQSIFGFRDACPENIVDFFEKIGEDGEDIYITQNHRSTPEILEFANKVNALNKMRVDKDLIATRPSGKKPVVKGFHSVKAEYEYITEVIEEKVGEGIALDDIAIIAATRTELLRIAGFLSEKGIENTLQAPEPMLENSRVQGIISLANVYSDLNVTKDILVIENCLDGGNILDTYDDTELLDIISLGRDRVLSIKREFEPKRSEAFLDLCEQIAGEDDVAVKLVERLGRFPTVEGKIDYIRLFEKYGGDSVKRDGKYSGVVLSTAHSSKGLEWPVVINSITKYDRNKISAEAVEERRRLLFVSATRARDELYVTGQIKLCGNEKDGYVYNRFVSEVHEITGTKIEYEDEEKKKKRKAKVEKAKEMLAKSMKEAS